MISMDKNQGEHASIRRIRVRQGNAGHGLECGWCEETSNQGELRWIAVNIFTGHHMVFLPQCKSLNQIAKSQRAI